MILFPFPSAYLKLFLNLLGTPQYTSLRKTKN